MFVSRYLIKNIFDCVAQSLLVLLRRFQSISFILCITCYHLHKILANPKLIIYEFLPDTASLLLSKELVCAQLLFILLYHELKYLTQKP